MAKQTRTRSLLNNELFWLVMTLLVIYLLDITRFDLGVVTLVQFLSENWSWWSPSVAETVMIFLLKGGFLVATGVTVYFLKVRG